MPEINEMLQRTLQTVAKANKLNAVLNGPRPLNNGTDYIDHATLHALRTVHNRPESKFNTLIDLGGASGAWGKHLDRLLDHQLNILFFEPNKMDWEKQMFTWARWDPEKYHVVWKAAWEDNRSITMILPSGSRFIGEVWTEEVKCDRSFTTEAARVDTTVAELQLPGPYFLKMDVHGSEVPALVGCRDIMDQIIGIHVECNFYNITPTARRSADLIHIIERLGFRLAYLGNITNTRFGLTWEVDALFLRADNPIFEEILGHHREQQALG